MVLKSRDLTGIGTDMSLSIGFSLLSVMFSAVFFGILTVQARGADNIVAGKFNSPLALGPFIFLCIQKGFLGI